MARIGERPDGIPVLTKQYHKSGNHHAYQNPYPLSEEVFLVSANRGVQICSVHDG